MSIEDHFNDDKLVKGLESRTLSYQSRFIQELYDASQLYDFSFNEADAYYQGKRVQYESFMMGLELEVDEPFGKVEVATIRWNAVYCSANKTRVKYYRHGVRLE